MEPKENPAQGIQNFKNNVDGTLSTIITLDVCWVAHLSRDMRFPTMWYVRPAKAKTSLRICAV